MKIDCDVCGRKNVNGGACSSLTAQPVSIAYCSRCLSVDAEAIWLLRATYGCVFGCAAEWWWDIAFRSVMYEFFDHKPDTLTSYFGRASLDRWADSPGPYRDEYDEQYGEFWNHFVHTVKDWHIEMLTDQLKEAHQRIEDQEMTMEAQADR